MSGTRVSYTLDDKAFRANVDRLGGVLRTGILRAFGTALVLESQHRFLEEREPFGARWAKLLPAYAMIKKGPGILRGGSARGLMETLTYQVSGSSVAIGSNKIYAGVHQFGATITAKNGKRLAFRLGSVNAKGKTKSGIVFAQSVHIPARPYLGFGPKDQRAVMETLQVFVNKGFG